MRTTATMLLGLTTLAMWAGSPAAPRRTQRAGSAPARAESLWACTFEDGTTQGWTGTGYGQGERQRRARRPRPQVAPGRFRPGPYPGIGIDFKSPQDWSAAQAFRFRSSMPRAGR